MMKYINLSLVSMIITAFVMKVVELFSGKTKNLIAPNGLTAEEWENAMANAKIYRDTVIVLHFANSGGGTLDWTTGYSIGPSADLNFMHWCWCNLVAENGYRLSRISLEAVCGSTWKLNPQWPLSTKVWAEMVNVYNALYHQAELRERK
jgi:hypothetical protein